LIEFAKNIKTKPLTSNKHLILWVEKMAELFLLLHDHLPPR